HVAPHGSRLSQRSPVPRCAAGAGPRREPDARDPFRHVVRRVALDTRHRTPPWLARRSAPFSRAPLTLCPTTSAFGVRCSAFGVTSMFLRLFPIALLLTFTALLAASPPKWETPLGWTETRGGAGGTVLRVTTLAADGPGSLA